MNHTCGMTKREEIAIYRALDACRRLDPEVEYLEVTFKERARTCKQCGERTIFGKGKQDEL